ncbi:MAG: hypothetical protein U5Q44_04165 [Dehalococcoidia bacterium]|nr:hypothetical protein [Dehalococcoidia bacterium]
MQSSKLRPRNIFTYGGLAAGVILAVFGIASMVIGYQGIQQVRDSLSEQQDRRHRGLVDCRPACRHRQPRPRSSPIPSAATPTRARVERCYSELPRFATEDGTGTNDAEEAVTNQFGEPVTNPDRATWLDAIALSTTLETAYFAEQVGIFAIVMGVALLLTGIGFIVLTVGLLWQHEPAEARENTGQASQNQASMQSGA